MLMNSTVLPLPLLQAAHGLSVLLFSTDQQIDAYFQNKLAFSENAELLSYTDAESTAVKTHAR